MFQEHVLDVLSPDVFIHTWTLSGSTYKKDSDIRDSKSVVTYDELKELYDPCKSAIEDFPKDGTKILNGQKLPKQFAYGYEALMAKSALPNFWKIYAANNLKVVCVILRLMRVRVLWPLYSTRSSCVPPLLSLPPSLARSRTRALSTAPLRPSRVSCR